MFLTNIALLNISHRDFLPKRTTASLFLEPTDEVEIKKIIRNLKE